ncbi:MAG: SCO family protein [Bacteroidales bacterium]|nr:SCO family protein [Bacteroidales bacterium]
MKIPIILFLLFSTVMTSCNDNSETKSKSCCSTKKTTETDKAISGESIYNLGSTWITQESDSVQLRNFAGKITIAAMVFTHCESACPRIVADMQCIESGLSGDELRLVNFLLISMDPDRDTPARMNEFAVEHKLNASWTLISSNHDATMEIANVLDVRVKKLENGGFDHSNVIFLLNKSGEILFQQNGFSDEQDEMLEVIQNQVN